MHLFFLFGSSSFILLLQKTLKIGVLMDEKDFDFIMDTIVEFQECVSQCRHNLNIFSAQLAFIESQLATRKKSLLLSYPFIDPPPDRF